MAAKNKSETDAGNVRIVNLRDGPRTFPLDGGAGLHLPGKHKKAEYPVIPETSVNKILRQAEKKGVIKIEKIEKAEGGKIDGPGNAESNVD